MAAYNLDQLRQLLQSINKEALQSKSLFNEWAAIVQRIDTARLGTSSAAAFKRANAELAKYLNKLRQAASITPVSALRATERAAMPAVRTRMEAAGMSEAQRSATMRTLLQKNADVVKAVATSDVQAWRRARAELDKYSQGLNKHLRGLERLQQAPVRAGPGGAVGATAKDTAQQQAFKGALGDTAMSTDQANKFLSKYGMTMNDLSKVSMDAGSRTKQFSFETGKAEGVVKRAVITFDKYGNVVRDTTARFRTFTNMIAKNIMKVVQWAVAVGVVYGALTKLREGTETLKEIDEAMSNIALSTGQTMDAVVGFFDASSAAARETGMNLEGVLNIYDDALRATRSIPGEGLRLEISDTLVRDALTFSRLAGVDTKTAMDTLVGALKQVRVEGEELSETLSRSGTILDLWVYTSQRANVSIKDLAETFAVTGAAAQSAGVDIHTLTALSAVLAESTSKSAAEVGNTIRRLLGQTQSETGNAALRRYGIALEDVTGKARDWDDIMTEIAVKLRAGVLSDAAIQDLAYAIGGGPRGSADFIAAIKAWDEVLSKASVSQTQSVGAAQEALALKAATLTTKLNELSTAWDTLVQTVGFEGGALQGLISTAEVLTTVVDAVDGLATALGPATIRMLAFAASMVVLSKYGPQIGMALKQSVLLGGAGGAAAGWAAPTARAGMAGMWETTKRRGAAAWGSGGLAMAGAYAGMAAMGRDEYKVEKAGAILGSAAISTLLGGSPIIGAAIGDAASEMIIGAVEKRKLLAQAPETLSKEDLTKQYEAAFGDILGKDLGFAKGLADLTKPGALDPIPEEVMKVYEESGREAAKAYLQAFYDQANKGMRESLPLGMGIIFSPITLDEDTLESMDKAFAARQEALERGMELPGGEKESILQKLITQEEKDMAEYGRQVFAMTDRFTALRQTALEEMLAGDISKKSYKDYVAGIRDAKQRAGILFEELENVSKDSLETIAENFAAMPLEVRDELVGLVTDINQLQKALAIEIDVELQEKLQEDLDQRVDELKTFYELGLQVQLNVEPFQFLGFTDLSDLTQTEIDEIRAQADEMQAHYEETFKMVTGVVGDNAQEWVTLNKEGMYQMQEDSEKIFFDFFKKKLDETKKQKDDFQIKRLKDIEPEDYPELVQRVQVWHKFLMQIPGYEQVEQEPINLVIGEDPQFRRLISTQEALRFALEELAAIEKKRLEGQWNIPEGATVMVPLTSLYYAPDKEAGGPGAGVFEGAEVVFDAAEASSTNLATTMDTTTLATTGLGESMVGLGALMFDVINREPFYEDRPRLAEEEKYGLAPEVTAPGETMADLGAIIANAAAQAPTAPGAGYGVWDIVQPEIDTAAGNVVNALEGVSLDSTLNSAVDAMTTVREAVFGIGDSINLLFNELIGKPEPSPAPIVINTTIELDGRVVARSVNRIQSEQLSQASSQDGYTSGGIIT